MSDYYGYGYGGGLTSPNKHFPLTALEGDAGTIEAAGNHYIAVGAQLTSTADELKKLGDATKYKAKALDKVRESARDLEGDLHKAGVRYSQSGPVLVTYAAALRLARSTTVDPLVEPIRKAAAAHDAAVSERENAQSKVDGLNDPWPWESTPTDAQKTAANGALSDAQSTERAAQQNLDGLWTSFESGFGAWETAYEDAAKGLHKAADASGINDKWWEDFLDGLAKIATIVGTIAVIAALVIGGPVFLAIAAVASIVALTAHVIMMAAGSKRVSWTDIALDAVGVVPFLGAFGKAAVAGKGALGALKAGLGLEGASAGIFAAGRNALTADLRTVVGAGRFAGNRAARDLAAPGLADAFFANGAGWGRSAWNALRGGGSIFDGKAYTLAQELSRAWPGAGRMAEGGRAAQWAAGASGMPGVVTQGFNVWNAGYGAYSSASNVGIPLPSMPDFIGAGADLIKGK